MPANQIVYFEFPHRMNKSGVMDSICPRCFATVGSSTWEADLDRMEAAHVCDSARLNSSNLHRRMPVVSDRGFASSDVSERPASAGRNTWLHRGRSTRQTA